MNLNGNDIELDEVLYRYFRNELAPDEKEEVKDWIDESPENQEKFDELKMLFLDLKGLSYYNKTRATANHSWEKFNKENNVRLGRSGSPRSFTFMKYAASTLVVISAVFGAYYVNNQPENVAIGSANEVRGFQLSDGSAIELNAEGLLEYQEPFSKNERKVKLAGDAYFIVEKDAERPFVVEVEGVEVRVLGTKFMITQSRKGEVDIMVDEGKVLVSFRDEHQIVGGGESIKVNTEKAVFSQIEDEIGLTTFWKNRKLVFNVTSLKDVVATVNQAYGTSIQLEGDAEGCALTVIFDNESIENVLEVISSTLNYKVIQNQGTYVLQGDGCQ